MDWNLSFDDTKISIHSELHNIRFSVASGYLLEFEEDGYSILDEFGFKLIYEENGKETLLKLELDEVEEVTININEDEDYTRDYTNFDGNDGELYKVSDLLTEYYEAGREYIENYNFNFFRWKSNEDNNSYDLFTYVMNIDRESNLPEFDVVVSIVKTENKEKWTLDGYSFINEDTGIKMFMIKRQYQSDGEDDDFFDGVEYVFPPLDIKIMKILLKLSD
jgi:hypothetical protein